MATIIELEKKIDTLAVEVAQLRARLGTDDVYIFTDEERAAVEEGLREVAAGDIATDEEVEAVYKKFGL